MFDLFKNFGSSDSISFFKLYNNLRAWQDAGRFPAEYELPEAISFTEDFWKRVIKLYKYTRADGFERAIAVFWADGDLILSSDILGNRKAVTPKSNVSVLYSASRHKGYLRKEVFLNDKLYSRKDVYEKKVPRQIEVKYLFNMHTHPPHEGADGQNFYTYFSAQDIKSLLASKAVITGMIGDKLNILFRTSSTPSSADQITDQQINMEFLVRELHIAVYQGDFKSKVKRVTIN